LLMYGELTIVIRLRSSWALRIVLNVFQTLTWVGRFVWVISQVPT
jgi:hypothetical protein